MKMGELIKTSTWEGTNFPHNNLILVVPKKAVDGRPQF